MSKCDLGQRDDDHALSAQSNKRSESIAFTHTLHDSMI